MKTKTKKTKLIPPDLKRCQAEKPNGWTFMTLGGRQEMVKYANKPTVIVKEKKPGDDGQYGSMTLCTDCLLVFMTQMSPSQETYEFEEIK